MRKSFAKEFVPDTEPSQGRLSHGKLCAGVDPYDARASGIMLYVRPSLTGGKGPPQLFNDPEASASTEPWEGLSMRLDQRKTLRLPSGFLLLLHLPIQSQTLD